MAKNNCVEVKLDFEVDVLTTGAAADAVSAIIEYLLYQRNQIPLVFPTFRTLISKWKINDECDEHEDYIIEKHRSMARTTLSGINNVKMVLKQELQRTTISCIRLLFGSTIATPREVYIIKLPEISRTHNPENHKISVGPFINKLIMSLITSENLYKVFSSHLPTTNMFVDLEVRSCNSEESEDFFQKECLDLPAKCLPVVIDIHHKRSNVSLNCCRELKVFKDYANMSISESNTSVKDEESDTKIMWLEANCFVRGFKDVPIRGKYLWQSETG